MSWPVEGAYGTGADPRRGAPDVRQETYEHMNAAQASWSVMSTRRTAPAWIQRLGAFFQEMRAQQAPQSMWTPSPLASPPQGGRRAIASPESEQGSWPSVGRGEHPLLSREQREQLQRMERRASLLYGPQGQDRHEASSGGSGGSTYEAVQEEVRRQLRGVVEQLEASRQEASELRREVVRLKSAQATEDPTAVVLTAPRGPPQAYGGYLAGSQSNAGAATSTVPSLPAGSSLTGGSGMHVGGATSTPTFAPLHAGASTSMEPSQPAGSSLTGGSGLHAGASTSTVPSQPAGSSFTGGSGLHAGASTSATAVQPSGSSLAGGSGVPARTSTPTPVTMSSGSMGAEGRDPMARLLEGLEKVIKGGGKPEELSKTTEAEKLPEISESSSVDFGDWLYCLEHTMGDISASSAEWWRYVVRDAQEYYDKYQSADQYARLSLKPSPSMELTQDRWSRVDRRGAAVLIAAVPEDVKKELVASRVKTTLDVLSRLMILYRPGSAMEKGQLLRRIENPEQAGSIQDAVEGLRHWQRYYQRAKDLRVNTPDPSILMRALDHMLKKAIADNPEVGFRMNLMRYHLRVDVAPTEDNVLAVHRAFLAEFEQMGYKKRAKGGVEQATGPRLRAMDKEQPQLPTSPTTIPKGGSRPCRFYLSDEGCRRGKSCKYEHSMKDLSKAERRDRCFECGAKGHLSSTCPTKKEVQQKAMSTGDSPQSSTGGTSNKKGGNSRRNAEEAAPEPPTTVTTTTPTTTEEPPVQGVPVEQLLEDAQKLMKAFMEQKSAPQVKVLRVEDASCMDSPALKELMRVEDHFVSMCQMGLLDSGATHPLRPRTDQDATESMGKVNVTLAGENRVEMQQSRFGTILGAKGSQAIVPLGTVVKQLGYEFAWTRRGCCLRHPTKGEIKVFTRSACPEIAQGDALKLIAELEEAKLTETMESLTTLRVAVASAKDRTQWSWKDSIREYVATGDREAGVRAVLAAPFMHHAPMNDQLKVMAEIPKSPEEAWRWMKSFPLNRARHRQLWQSGEWVVHIFSGKGVKNDPLRELPGILEIDLQKGWDLNDDKTYGVLLWAARTGRVKHVFGGPPVGTFSAARYKTAVEGFRPVRSNHEPWGVREGLGVDDVAKVRNENLMLFRMVWLWVFAEAAHDDPDVPGNKVSFCLEYPEDPREYLPEGQQKQQCVSVWRTDFMKELEKVTQFDKVKFEQGALGHMLRRPTCCLTNLGLGINGLKDSRAFVTSEGAEPDQSVWPHGFRITLADAIHEWNAVRGGVAIKKAMTKTELAEWKAHVERGHWPYRRDCSVCLSASGTGRPARRVVHRDAYVLSLDIAGPFAEVGRDEVRGCRYRFVLAATYLYPKIREVPEDAPLPDEEEADKFLMEEEEDPEDGEQGPEDPSADAQEEEWKKKIEDLKKPMEMQALRFCVPLEQHRGKEILEAVQDLYVKIRAMGLPLTRIHSDRAREFRVKPLRKWCRERDIFQTYTEGLAPTQNAMAESHVKWLKGQARLHLQGSELEKQLWPCAMKHACKQHNARELGEKGTEIKFGAVVWVKSKKDRGPFDPRWERGVYLGPADDVREGHVVRLDDGSWLRTLHMRTVRDDEANDDEEEYVVDLIEPTRRVKGKTKLGDPELRAFNSQDRQVLVDKLLASKIWETPEAKVERPQMREGEMWKDAAK